jgi:hypothetical protein
VAAIINLVVVLKSTGRPVALSNYGARQAKSGVRVQVNAGRTMLRHAFIATTNAVSKACRGTKRTVRTFDIS